MEETFSDEEIKEAINTIDKIIYYDYDRGKGKERVNYIDISFSYDKEEPSCDEFISVIEVLIKECKKNRNFQD